MKTFGARQVVTTLAVSIAVWAAVATGCLAVSSSGEFGFPTRDVFKYRAQVVLIASLVGAALACAGVAYQAILNNPLAEPYLLGVSSGSALAAYLWQLPAMSLTVTAVGFAPGQQLCAFAGAAMSVGVALALGSRRGRLEPITLLLVGVIINAVNGSVFMLLNSIVKETATPGGPLSFLFGTIQTNLQRGQLMLACGVIAACFALVYFFAGQLNALTLTDAEAQSLGVSVNRVRWLVLGAASLMTASAVAISGPIGFVGLVCPHVARLLVGSDRRRLLPVATALGAAMLTTADAASRYLSSIKGVDTYLPVGVITGLLGGPFFLLLLWRHRRSVSA